MKLRLINTSKTHAGFVDASTEVGEGRIVLEPLETRIIERHSFNLRAKSGIVEIEVVLPEGQTNGT